MKARSLVAAALLAAGTIAYAQEPAGAGAGYRRGCA